ncbi:MAG: POTRA domain-containing protein [Cyclobacteriaceae bacterium]
MKRSFFISFLFVQVFVSWSQTFDSTELVTINKVEIDGNRKTKTQIITRELSFSEGEQYKRFQLDSMFVWDRNRIYRTNLFNEVTFSIIEVSDDRVDIRINVQERWYVYPIPIFKLVDRNFNDWWVNRDRDLSRTNIGLRLSHFNFRGRSELLRITTQFGFTTRLSMLYRIPYIEKTQKHGLSFNFAFLEAKNLAVVTQENVRRFLQGEELLRTVYRSRVTHSYRNSFYSFHFLNLGHTSVNIADTVAVLNPNYIGDGTTSQSYFRAGYQYAWDKRDNRNYPLDGEWYTAGITKFGLGINNSNVDFWTLNFSAARFRELGNEFYQASNLIGLISLPQDRSYFNYFSIGFLKNSLRGYELNVVEGSTYFIQKNDIKKKVFSRKKDISRFMPVRQFQTFPITLYGKVFFDQGYAKGYPNYGGSDKLDDQYLYAFGLGFDLVIIHDSVFRFELSRNKLDETNFFINFLSAF